MLRRLKTLLLIISSLVSVLNALGQADISMATQWYNRSNYNPASIVRTEYFYLFSNIREQWYGVTGAPKVFNLEASGYVHRYHSAFGISLSGETIGVTQVYNPMISYAYRVSNEVDWALAMGVSGGVFNRLSNGAKFQAVNPNDPAIPYGKDMYTQPDANVGFEFQAKYFIISLSSTHILSINNSDKLFLNANHRYGSLIFKSSDPDMFNYHLGLQVVNRNNYTVYEGNVGIRFKHPTLLQSGPREILDIGLTYRSSQEMTLLFAFNVSANMRIGYAYDQSFNTGYNVNGTHEFMIEYRIPMRAASTHGQFESQEYWYH